MSLMEKIKKNSTIKETSILTDSRFFNTKELIQTTVPALNVALSGKLDGGLTPGLTVFAGPSKHFKTAFALLLSTSNSCALGGLYRHSYRRNGLKGGKVKNLVHWEVLYRHNYCTGEMKLCVARAGVRACSAFFCLKRSIHAPKHCCNQPFARFRDLSTDSHHCKTPKATGQRRTEC